MPSLSDLWDENKYSEGDPIRQLISATKAAKEWPMDALAWGADLVDLGSSGLSKALHNQDLRTDLGGNLRRAVTPPLYEGKPSFSAPRAEDLEDARSVGRMLNPLLLGGNQKLPGSGIVDKIVNKLTGVSDIDKGKRAFLVGKPTEDQVNILTDILTTPVTRREFMKNSALVSGGVAAASIPGVKLLQKFAPEERAIAKEAVTEAAPKYKYNSLKEYLDDVTDYSHDIGHERAYESAMEHGYNNHPGADRYMDNFVDNFDFSKIQRERLLADETAYNEAKRNLSSLNPKKDFNTGLPPRSQVDLLNAFSPQAKKEMKAYKRSIDSWNNAGGGVYKDIGKRDWTDQNYLQRFIEELEYYNQSSIPHPFMTKDPYNTLK